MSRPTLLFDGHCLLCSRAVHFIHRHDRGGVFRFAAQQSPDADKLLQGHTLPPDLDSVILVDHGQVFTHSDAVLRIVPHLGWRFRWLALFRILPRPLRDSLYRFVARHRYRIFGRSDTCFTPTPDLRARFSLDTPPAAPPHPAAPPRDA